MAIHFNSAQQEGEIVNNTFKGDMKRSTDFKDDKSEGMEDTSGRLDEIIKRENDIIQLIRQGDDIMTLNDGVDTEDFGTALHASRHNSNMSPRRINDMDLLQDRFDDVIRQFHNDESARSPEKLAQKSRRPSTETSNRNENDEDVDDKFVLEDHQSRSKEFYENDIHDLKEVIPPENFSHVVGDIYRSSFPRVENFDFLVKRLKLKSILVLIPEEYPAENLEFMEKAGIKLFQVGMSGNKEPFVNIPSDLLTKALETVLDPHNQPILIHCNRGKHRTGCLIGCIRKLQNWSLTMIFDEYRRFAFPKARALDQQFIEMYDDHDIKKVASANNWLPLQW